MDQGFIIRFLMSNLMLSLFLAAVYGSKRLLKNQITIQSQYRISQITLAAFIAPFLTISYGGIELLLRNIFSAFTNASADPAMVETATNHLSETNTNWIQDYTVTTNDQQTFSVIGILLFVWVLGMVAFCIYQLVGLHKLASFKKTILPASDPSILDIFEKCRAEVGVKGRVKLGYSDALTEPVTFGLLSPYVILPAQTKLSAKNIEHILLHELIHCRRKDIVLNTVINIIRTVYWFNPVVWIYLNSIKNETEITCDYAVLNILGEESHIAYGELLVGFASDFRRRDQLQPASGMGGTFRQIKKRLYEIIHFSRNSGILKRKNVLALLLVTLITVLCIPSFSAMASDDVCNVKPANMVVQDFSQYFNEYEGSFVLYDPAAGQYIFSDEKEGLRRYAPYSTYKIVSGLAGLEEEIIAPESSLREWNGNQQPYEEWERDQDIYSAMENSVSWYFQSIDTQIGYDKAKQYYTNLEYGNERLSGNMETYWMDNSLKISAYEQIQVMQKLYDNEIGAGQENIDTIKAAIYLEETGDVRLFGKTGTGINNSLGKEGWLIGYVENDGQVFFYATHIYGTDNASGREAAQITLAILNQLGIYGAN